ncbi:MAG: VWA domain-containing protein [Pseudomonadota bacterium]
MMAELHFLRPWWLVAIPVVLALGAWYWLRGAGVSHAWRALVAPDLRDAVLIEAGPAERSVWTPVLLTLAVITGALALAGPAWERQSVPVTRDGDAMVIALDLSRSMEATDVGPSRLARARLKLKDILRERQGGETALVVFSANAFVVTPLTDDIDTIDAIVPTLTPSLMPSRGSYPEAGLDKARQLLEQAGVKTGRILLITDGGNLPPALTSARAIRDAGHTVSVLAVGTEAGGPIPAEDSGFVTDGRGNIALPKVPIAGLRRLADAGDGAFARLSADESDLAALSLTSQPGGISRDSDASSQSIERWLDRGPWITLLLLPLVAIAFRRGGYVVAGCLALMMITPVPAQASTWDALWKNRDQRGAEALEAGKAYEAAELFKDPAWQASAAYRAGDFGESAAQFEGLEGATARYNHATALARSGEIADAITAYENLLADEPDHEDAQHNLDVLRELQGNQQQGGENGGEGDSGEGDPQDGGQQQDGSGSAQGGDAQDGQSGDDQPTERNRQTSSADEEAEREAIEEIQRQLREAQADPNGELSPVQVPTAEERTAAEQQQALEQWLRRIPDDPGGLLRRKFRYQYQRRQTDQDGIRLWPDDRTEPW